MRKDIGDILLSTGTINTQQLAECRTAIQENGGSLENCILSKNFVTSQLIAQAYAKYASLDYIDAIGDKMADMGLMSKVPLKFLRDHGVIPILFNDQVTIATSNPLDFQPLDELNMLLGGIARYAVADRAVIIDAINRYYPLEGTKQMIEELAEEDRQMQEVSFEQIEEKDILAMATEAPIIKLVNHILFQAVKRGASDIHIEPFEKDVRVRYRIDGVMLDLPY